MWAHRLIEVLKIVQAYLCLVLGDFGSEDCDLVGAILGALFNESDTPS
jgi:hypothetical protein